MEKGTYLDSDNRLAVVRAAECCNQHLKNIVALRHFHFCCLWLLETEGNSLRAVFDGSASSVRPLPERAATAPASPISPGHFPQLKLILSIPRPPACLPPACWPPACHTVPEPACDLFHSPVKSYLLYLGTPGSEMYLSNQMKANFPSLCDTIPVSLC